MAKRTISITKLEQLVKKGNTVSQIAKKMKVSKGGVSKALKKLNVAITKDVALHHASEIVSKEIDASDQLFKINQNANELLDKLMQVIQGDKEALEQVEPMLGGKSSPIDAAIKLKSEIRQQLRLQLEIFQTLYDMKAVAEFQREVLEAIRDASPEIRDRIVRNLQKTRAIRSTLDFC